MRALRESRVEPVLLNRRSLLGFIGVTGLGIALAACAPAASPTPGGGAPATVPAAPPTAPPAREAPAGSPPAAKAEAGGTPVAKAPPSASPASKRTFQPVNVKLASSTSPRVDTLRRVGEKQGFFRDFAVSLEFVQIMATADTMRAVLTGEVTFATLDVPTALTGIDGGTPVKLLGTYEAKLGHIIFARPEIKTLKDLEGKSVGITGTGGLPDNITREIFRQQGVDASKVEFISLRGSAGIYQAVVANKVAAGAATDAYAASAQRDGVVPLVKTWEVLPNYISSVFVASEQEMTKYHDEIVRTLAGFVKAFRYVNTPSAKPVWVEVAMAEVEQDRDQAEVAWQGVQDSTPYRPDPTMVRAEVDYMQQFTIALGRQKSMHPYEQLVDVTLMKEAMALL